MDLPVIVSREEWLAARDVLLAKEKQATRARDAVTAERRALPMVEVAEPYTFHGADGQKTLEDLFDGRRQLIVQHFMWRFDRDDGCPSCSLIADNVGDLSHLHACDTTLVAVSRAPYERIARFRDRMGWRVPWYSSHGSGFNADFGATREGQDVPGLSVFLRDGGRVFHTYSTFARGAELLLGTYNYLDLTALGRQRYVTEFPHHDTYGEPACACHH
jgi:predicted dithiol-disulfide oxidoreductase (DUF899 family)